MGNQRNLRCKTCGVAIPYRSPEAYEDRCDDCIERAENPFKAGDMVHVNNEATVREVLKVDLPFVYIFGDGWIHMNHLHRAEQ